MKKGLGSDGESAEPRLGEHLAMPAKLYSIPKGLVVSIALDDGNKRWARHVMRRTLILPEYRTHETAGTSGAIIFKYNKWLILTRRNRVKTTKKPASS